MGTMGIFMAMFFVLFGIAFVTILVLIISAGVKAAQAQARNNAAPEVQAAAEVIGKRIETHGGGESSVRQLHYATFEQPSGERFELECSPTDFGLLAEGDRGTVTMKGTRFVAFAREIMR